MADKNVQALLIPKDWDEMDAESESSQGGHVTLLQRSWLATMHVVKKN